jgi:hypothetical protein
MFPFPVSTAKYIGDFYNNRRSAANRRPRLTYSFISRENFLLALRIRPASLIDAAKVPRFAYKRQMPRSANNISCGCYIAPILLALRRSYSFTYYSRTRLLLGHYRPETKI